MIQQLLNYLQGSVVQWFIRFEPVDAVWDLYARVASGVSTLIAWTPEVPYVPFGALWFCIVVVIGTWTTLFGLGMIINWIVKLKP